MTPVVDMQERIRDESNDMVVALGLARHRRTAELLAGVKVCCTPCSLDSVFFLL